MRPWVRKAGASIALACLVLVMLPSVSANPMVPYCGPATVGGGFSGGGAAVLPEVCEATTGRVFPEAIEDPDYLGMGPRGFICTDANPTGACTGFARDYVGYFEFQAGLNYLASSYPDWIEVHEVAMSEGNANMAGGPVSVPIYMLEISNEKSPIPRNEKQNILFMLSIHGNEKGGREGGFRVLEDLLRDIGFARETVHNGAGMPAPLAKPTGGNVETYRDYLDFMNIFLLFPNSDGWSCDEIEYGVGAGALGQPGGCAGQFRRGNGNGVDLNRQTPTLGWHNPNRDVAGQSEANGYLNWMIQQQQLPGFNWTYAIDIHGMLQHRNFGAIMLPAGSFSPQEMARSLSLADTLKEYWNAEAEGTNGNHFQEWATLFAGAEEAWEQSGPARQAYIENCATFDCPLPGSALAGASPTQAASSPQFAEYYTVIDAIGYTDSGFSGDFFAQTTGLNAPGYDIELAYNHIVTGAQYGGPGALLNDYHVWMVRHIVKSFMDAGGLDVQISYETKGTKTAYIIPQYVATNLDDVDEEGNPRLTPGGWADQNAGDDHWQYSAEQPFEARPARYWEDMAPFLCEGCAGDVAIPGTLLGIQASGVPLDKFTQQLANFDNLVIPGTAINQLIGGEWSANQVANGTVDQAKVDAILAWVDAGGNLILTDAGLKFLDVSGLTNNAVEMSQAYMGGIRMDLDHSLLAKVRGGVKQVYEPTPLGFGTTGTSPNWGVDPAQFSALGGSVAGFVCGGSQLTQNCNNNDISLGVMPRGEGSIQVMGSLLPDPTEEFYHPYGLDHYATTYSGNQIMRNMLGWDEVFKSPPLTIAEGKISQSKNEPVASGVDQQAGSDAAASGKGSPLGLLVALSAIGAALLLRRRG